MKKRNIFIGIAIALLIAVFVNNYYDFNSYPDDKNVCFIENHDIESIHDLTKIESLTQKTVLVNLWTPNSENCLYSNKNENDDFTNIELLHVFCSNDFNRVIDYKRFIKKKQVKGKYLLLSVKSYSNLVKEIYVSQKGTCGAYPVQCVVNAGEIIDINESNKVYLSTFRKK